MVIAKAHHNDSSVYAFLIATEPQFKKLVLRFLSSIREETDLAAPPSSGPHLESYRTHVNDLVSLRCALAVLTMF